MADLLASSRAAISTALIACVLFFLILFPLRGLPFIDAPVEVRQALMVVGSFAFLVYAQKQEGPRRMLAGGLLVLPLLYLSHLDPYFATVVLSAGMVLAPLYWLDRKGFGTGEALRELGLHKKQLGRNIALGILLTLALIPLLYALTFIYQLLGIADGQKVIYVIDAVPMYLLVLALIVNPITEEIFFRGFLVPRVGILPSAIAFSLAHLAYGSTMQIVSIFFIGLVFGAVYGRTRSLVPTIVCHILINSAAIYLIRFAG